MRATHLCSRKPRTRLARGLRRQRWTSAARHGPPIGTPSTPVKPRASASGDDHRVAQTAACWALSLQRLTRGTSAFLALESRPSHVRGRPSTTAWAPVCRPARPGGSAPSLAWPAASHSATPDATPGAAARAVGWGQAFCASLPLSPRPPPHSPLPTPRSLAEERKRETQGNRPS